MKNIKSLILLAIVLCAISLSSCGALANMSEEDAHNLGYGIGTLLR